MINYEKLEGKILADRESRKLGRIVRIRNILPASVNSQAVKPTIVIKIERTLRKELIVEMDADIVNRIEGYYAWTRLSRKEFFELLKDSPKLNNNFQPKLKIDLAPLKNYKGPPPGN